MASSRASAVASIIASDKVGWGCIEFNISLYVVSKSLASDISEIKSVAFAPIIWQPNNSPYFSSKIILTKPSVWPIATAFPRALKGNFPTLILKPLSTASFSVKPTDATSGWQYVQPGILSIS